MKPLWGAWGNWFPQILLKKRKRSAALITEQSGAFTARMYAAGARRCIRTARRCIRATRRCIRATRVRTRAAKRRPRTAKMRTRGTKGRPANAERLPPAAPCIPADLSGKRPEKNGGKQVKEGQDSGGRGLTNAYMLYKNRLSFVVCRFRFRPHYALKKTRYYYT
jgi:hypothetical protein